MTRFSRPWRCPAAKSTPPRLCADSTGMLHNLRRPSMPYPLEAREDHKLELTAEMLRCRGTVQLRAWGTSMLPSVWPGDVLTIQGVAHDELVPGDIVLALRDNRFFVHRLIERRELQDCTLWITRGDAMPCNDPPSTALGLLGRVASILRANRSFVPNGFGERERRLHGEKRTLRNVR
jgi:hypothetical protein